MITVQISDHIDSLAETLEEDYTRYKKSANYIVGNSYNGYITIPRYIINEFITTGLITEWIDDFRKLTDNELKEYMQILEKVINDRLEKEGAPFTIIAKPFSRFSKKLDYDVIGYKLDYSCYTGTEDIELLNV